MHRTSLLLAILSCSDISADQHHAVDAGDDEKNVVRVNIWILEDGNPCSWEAVSGLSTLLVAPAAAETRTVTAPRGSTSRFRDVRMFSPFHALAVDPGRRCLTSIITRAPVGRQTVDAMLLLLPTMSPRCGRPRTRLECCRSTCKVLKTVRSRF